jgi:ubiquinone/menaquinone biosynthesis C-methylase UbiE
VTASEDSLPLETDRERPSEGSGALRTDGPLTDNKRAVPREFDRIAPTYELLTGLNPGYHRHLRRSAERLSVRTPRPRLLDLCCGTGASTEALRAVYPDADIVGLDASEGMLEVARRKASLRDVALVHGDATDPAAVGVEGPFDGVLMAYGIRNLPDPDRGLSNLRRLLRPGASVVFHEYSVADSALASLVWDAVCWGIIVPGGVVTARSTAIYRYLHRSVRAFDGVRAFERRLERAGYVDVWTGPMDGWQRGIVHSFVARRPRS